MGDCQTIQKKIIFLVTPGFEESLTLYCLALIRKAGLSAVLAGISLGNIKGINGISIRVDYAIGQINPDRVQTVAISGGKQHISSLLADPRVKEFLECSARNIGFRLIWLDDHLKPNQFSWLEVINSIQYAQQRYLSIDEFANHLIDLNME